MTSYFRVINDKIINTVYHLNLANNFQIQFINILGYQSKSLLFEKDEIRN